jgi:hypothetical protein
MADEVTPTEVPPAVIGKAELLERTRREYAALEDAIGGLTEAQLTAPLDGDWSIKDMLAHLAAWQQILLRFHIGRQPFSEAAPHIAVDYQTSDVDTINAALFQRDRALPLADVLDTFRRSHQQTLATIEAMSEADLFRQYTPPGRDAADGGQLINWIVGDTYEHYMEHRATIEKVSSV